jgi:acetyl esterase/lipase
LKKVLKVLTIFIASILLTTLGIIIYFNDSLSIAYNVYMELKNSNKSIETLGQLTNYYVTNSMDIKRLKYKESESNDVFLDIYRSELNDDASPVILYVHGGSWIYGDNGIPTGLEPIIKAFNKEGYTIVSVSYELLKDDTPIENPIKDVKDAIRWIYKNKTTYNFDTENIGILGISSGAHLGLMASYSKDDDFIGDTDLSKYSSKISYIIDVFGPTDLSSLDISSVGEEYTKEIENLLKSTTTLNNYNPIKYISKSSPSTLIIHSKTDEIVPYKNATSLYSELIYRGIKTKLLTLNSGSHYFNGYTQSEISALVFEILKFLDLNNK